MAVEQLHPKGADQELQLDYNNNNLRSPAFSSVSCLIINYGFTGDSSASRADWFVFLVALMHSSQLSRNVSGGARCMFLVLFVIPGL